MQNQETQNAKVNTYDEVPYISYPFAQSNLYHLMTLGVLFGMNPVKPENAKVLELGCGGGGNLIPHAVKYPKAKFVGIDLSKVHIDSALKQVEGLGLKNVEFRQGSIADINDSDGKFDYIVCHGVISWVPDFVRDKIFEICSKNLSPNGLSYISYNTLPGWNMVRTIRDMMLYHSSSFTNIQEKISQSRLLVNFIKESLDGATSPYADFLRAEADVFAKHSDNYLRHDHLEENNKQYYFYEFIGEAQKHGLQYLSDSHISAMYVGNMPAKAVEKLAEIKDIVKLEQYMDFINNRRFRSTILCHNNVPLSRNLDNEIITKFNMTMNIVPEKPIAEVDLNNVSETLNFFLNGNSESRLSTSSPYMKGVLYTFAESLNNPISVDKLTVAANKKLGGNKLQEIKIDFMSNAMRLVLQGYIIVTLQETRVFDLEKPHLAKLAHYQISSTDNLWVTNLNHETVSISTLDKFVFRYMNGKNKKEQILESVIQHIESGEIVLNKDGEQVKDVSSFRKEIKLFVDQSIKKAEINALLV